MRALLRFSRPASAWVASAASLAEGSSLLRPLVAAPPLLFTQEAHCSWAACPSLSSGTPASPRVSLRDFRPLLSAPAAGQAYSTGAAAGEDAAAASYVNPLLQAPAPGRGSPGGLPPEELRARAVLRKIKIAPKKLNMWAKLMRRMHIQDALAQCEISVKKSARLCHKVLLLARANAVHNLHMDPSRLQVDLAVVGQGSHQKRVMLHGRGRAGRGKKYRSHLTIVLREGTVRPRTRYVRPLLERPRKFWPGANGALAAAPLGMAMAAEAGSDFGGVDA